MDSGLARKYQYLAIAVGKLWGQGEQRRLADGFSQLASSHKEVVRHRGSHEVHGPPSPTSIVWSDDEDDSLLRSTHHTESSSRLGAMNRGFGASRDGMTDSTVMRPGLSETADFGSKLDYRVGGSSASGGSRSPHGHVHVDESVELVLNALADLVTRPLRYSIRCWVTHTRRRRLQDLQSTVMFALQGASSPMAPAVSSTAVPSAAAAAVPAALGLSDDGLHASQQHLSHLSSETLHHHHGSSQSQLSPQSVHSSSHAHTQPHAQSHVHPAPPASWDGVSGVLAAAAERRHEAADQAAGGGAGNMHTGLREDLHERRLKQMEEAQAASDARAAELAEKCEALQAALERAERLHRADAAPCSGVHQPESSTAVAAVLKAGSPKGSTLHAGLGRISRSPSVVAEDEACVRAALGGSGDINGLRKANGAANRGSSGSRVQTPRGPVTPRTAGHDMLRQICSDQARIDEVVRLANVLWDSGVLQVQKRRPPLLKASLLTRLADRCYYVVMRDSLQLWFRQAALRKTLEELHGRHGAAAVSSSNGGHHHPTAVSQDPKGAGAASSLESGIEDAAGAAELASVASALVASKGCSEQPGNAERVTSLEEECARLKAELKEVKDAEEKEWHTERESYQARMTEHEDGKAKLTQECEALRSQLEAEKELVKSAMQKYEQEREEVAKYRAIAQAAEAAAAKAAEDAAAKAAAARSAVVVQDGAAIKAAATAAAATRGPPSRQPSKTHAEEAPVSHAHHHHHVEPAPAVASKAKDSAASQAAADLGLDEDDVSQDMISDEGSDDLASPVAAVNKTDFTSPGISSDVAAALVEEITTKHATKDTNYMNFTPESGGEDEDDDLDDDIDSLLK
eukprot:TRINITY_DN3110_c0_g2_i1.p1 TRINITY_DN3110_c0_g2~~TRINITY_DN3110_c0_g2_i1.p1  ORF type:complete len:859 (-),score=235.10 TRINITY_DN3110_c0_g2_i1:162-2738(-)